MKRICNILLLSLIPLLFACSKENNQAANNGLRPAKGGKFYGGTFRLNETEKIRTLFPLGIIDSYSYRVASHIYEGLFKFDPVTLQLTNGIAESYEVSQDGHQYTIKLRDNVFFHDDACFASGTGRKVTAQDVAFVFENICTPDKNNKHFFLFDGIVRGAKEYYEQKKAGQNPERIDGVEVLDERTLRITLLGASVKFVYNLARPGAFIYPKEAYEKYGDQLRNKTVGTGPFMLDYIEDDRAITLKRNPKYYLQDADGNQLPYLDGISISFISEKKLEYLEFDKGNLDMMHRVPADQITNILENALPNPNGGFDKFVLQRKAEMSTQFLSFMNQGEMFKDINLRKAFSFAIDRNKILEYVLNGEGEAPGENGITPPCFLDYDISKIKGYKFDLDSAKFYFKKAGYGQGKPFPALELSFNAEGERHANVASEVQKQLKEHLNIEISLKMVTHSQILEAGTMGQYDLIRLAWRADYPSPENFLWFFYGNNVPDDKNTASFPNIPRYKNRKFDELYEKGINAPTPELASQYFMQAENLLMEDAPVLVLWYDEGYRLIQPNVRGLEQNPMEYRDFTKVYFEKVEKKEN